RRPQRWARACGSRRLVRAGFGERRRAAGGGPGARAGFAAGPPPGGARRAADDGGGAAELRTGDRLQPAGGPARDRRSRDADGRRHRDVGQLADRGWQFAAAGSSGGMTILLLLIPAALAIGGLGLAAFFWALRNGQF